MGLNSDRVELGVRSTSKSYMNQRHIFTKGGNKCIPLGTFSLLTLPRISKVLTWDAVSCACMSWVIPINEYQLVWIKVITDQYPAAVPVMVTKLSFSHKGKLTASLYAVANVTTWYAIRFYLHVFVENLLTCMQLKIKVVIDQCLCPVMVRKLRYSHKGETWNFFSTALNCLLYKASMTILPTFCFLHMLLYCNVMFPLMDTQS